MNTEQAIYELKKHNEYTHYILLNKEVNSIIELLQRGEKFEKIVNELAKINIGENGEYGYQRRKLVEELKQKYFPKEK